MTERILSPLTYVLITVILLSLTIINIGIAYINLHGANTILALLIAAAEAVIMLLVFMHLRWSDPMTRLAAIAGLFWLGILMSGTLDDVLTRVWLPVPGK